jgi:hypothetical protein
MPACFARAQARRVIRPAQLGIALRLLAGGVQVRKGSPASDDGCVSIEIAGAGALQI